jgi:hypothetical protein
MCNANPLSGFGLFGGPAGAGTTTYKASGGIPGVGAMNPYLANPSAIPVPTGVALNGFQAQSANMDYSNYANAIQQAQGVMGEKPYHIRAEADRASDQANAMQTLSRQNVVSPTTQQMGQLAGQQSAVGGQNVTAGTVQQQQGLADVLRAQMAGQGPSLAQLQLQQATQQNAQNAASQIGSVRGINPAMAARGTVQAMQAGNQAAAMGSAQIRNAEQMQAQQQLGGVLNQMGGVQLGQQGTNIQGLAAAGQTLGNQGQLNLGQQQTQLQGLQGAGNIHLGAGNLHLGTYGTAVNQFGTAGGLQNAQNSNILSNVQQQNQINAGVAGQNAQLGLAGQQLAQNAYMANQQNYLDTQRINAGIYGQNANLGLGAQQINAGIAAGNAKAQGDLFGGLLNGGMAALGGFSGGGQVPAYDDGGMVDVGGPLPQLSVPDFTPDGGSGGRGVAEAMQNFGSMIFGQKAAGMGAVPPAAVPAAGIVPAGFAKGGKVPTDADLGKKREAELPVMEPEYQLPVYRGETAAAQDKKKREAKKPEQRYATGGMAGAMRGRVRGGGSMFGGFGGFPGRGGIPDSGGPFKAAGGVPREMNPGMGIGQAAPTVSHAPWNPTPGYPTMMPTGPAPGTQMPGGGVWSLIGGGDQAQQAARLQLQQQQHEQQLAALGGPTSKIPGSAFTPMAGMPVQLRPPPSPEQQQALIPAITNAARNMRGFWNEGGEIDGTMGGTVPGVAEVAGDSPKNDTVEALVSPGEGIIPRTIMQSPNAPQLAAEFVSMLKGRERARGYCSGGTTSKKKGE